MTDKPNIHLFKGGMPANEMAGELAERIVALLDEYSGRIPTATAIGVLAIVAAGLVLEGLGDD